MHWDIGALMGIATKYLSLNQNVQQVDVRATPTSTMKVKYLLHIAANKSW